MRSVGHGVHPILCTLPASRQPQERKGGRQRGVGGRACSRDVSDAIMIAECAASIRCCAASSRPFTSAIFFL
jgi:hypothetical protein